MKSKLGSIVRITMLLIIFIAISSLHLYNIFADTSDRIIDVNTTLYTNMVIKGNLIINNTSTLKIEQNVTLRVSGTIYNNGRIINSGIIECETINTSSGYFENRCLVRTKTLNLSNDTFINDGEIEYDYTYQDLSSDATLKDIKINGISIPDFQPEITAYTVYLPSKYKIVPTLDFITNDTNAELSDSNPNLNHGGGGSGSGTTIGMSEDGSIIYYSTVRYVTAQDGLTIRLYSVTCIAKENSMQHFVVDDFNYAIADELLTIGLTLHNQTAINIPTNLIIVAYGDKNKVLKVDKFNKTINGFSLDNFNPTVNYNNLTGIKNIKVFLWNSYNLMAPLSKAYEINL